MYISGTIILVIIVACILSIASKSNAEHSADLRRKAKLINEAAMVKERFNGIPWDKMNSQDRGMYQCAIERLNYLQSLKKSQTHQERLLPPWPENPYN